LAIFRFTHKTISKNKRSGNYAIHDAFLSLIRLYKQEHKAR
jgi:hypothetical protein